MWDLTSRMNCCRLEADWRAGCVLRCTFASALTNGLRCLRVSLSGMCKPADSRKARFPAGRVMHEKHKETYFCHI